MIKIAKRNGKKLETISEVSNGAEELINMAVPYSVEVTITGTSPLLFHRWNCEAVEENSNKPKGDASKKFDDPEIAIYRDAKRNICLPGEYLRMAMVVAAKSRQDPRSPRKNASDIFKSSVIVLTELATLGTKDWDYLDKRRVRIQMAAVSRTRPAFTTGWKATFVIRVLQPGYISQQLLRQVLHDAGAFVGLGDYRPTYGRFDLINFTVLNKLN